MIDCIDRNKANIQLVPEIVSGLPLISVSIFGYSSGVQSNVMWLGSHFVNAAFIGGLFFVTEIEIILGESWLHQ